MSVKNILISQPAPQNNSPYADIVAKYGLNIDFVPFFKAEAVSEREFRSQKISFLDYTAVVFTSKTAIDAFFTICEKTRVTMPDDMKYFCSSEAIALYLQKYIVYRKRKISFGNGKPDSIIGLIGPKHKGEKFLITFTDRVHQDFCDLFGRNNLSYGSVVLVQTRLSDLSSIDPDKYQMLVFYSPTDVKSLRTNFPDFKQGNLLIATYGTKTAGAAREAGFNIEIEAPTPEAPSIAKALQIYLESH